MPYPVSRDRPGSFYLRVRRVDINDHFDVGRWLDYMVDADIDHSWLASVVLYNDPLASQPCDDPSRHFLEVASWPCAMRVRRFGNRRSIG